MRTIEINVFDYNELSDSAKETAFDNWSERRQNYGYSWSDEVSKILDHIESNTPIRVQDLQYDTCNYSYDLGVTGYNGKDDDMYHVTGLRAAKIVLGMYYAITKENQFYCRRTDYEGNSIFGYRDEKYIGQTEKNRRTAFYKHDNCFTGYCESETFARALFDSVRDNNSYTVLEHFEIAFNKLFSSVVSDYNAVESEEYFIDNDANDAEYTECGDIFS